jgi:hypothetical protein
MGITNTGATTINGDVGAFPTASITGFSSVTLTGVNHADDAVTQNAKGLLTAAYNDASLRTATTTYTAVYELGGSTLQSGVFGNASSYNINGILTLDGNNDPNAVWIFQTGSTLTTGSASQIKLVNGANAANVFWQVGSGATLGSGSSFNGNILAGTSIALNDGAKVNGLLFAETGSVTLIGNTINSVPEPSGFILLCSGLVLFTARRKR